MKKKTKTRLDQILVDRNIAKTKNIAQSMIMAGQITVDNKIITKSGTCISVDSKITIKKLHPTWVSRGALKLIKAIQHFNIIIKDKVCLDIGSSTGGFTEVLLKNNAKKIYSVDVGTNQLHEKLKKERKIVSIENFNARYINEDIISDKIDLLVCDVSFISLKKVIYPSLNLLSNCSELIVLIKPQFETEKKNLHKGVVKDIKIHQEICNNIVDWFENTCKANVIGVVESPIVGPKGNKEFLLYSLL